MPVAPDGMNQAVPVHAVPPTFTRWTIDGLHDKPGLVRARGRITGSSILASNRKVQGITAAWNMGDQLRYGVIHAVGPPSTALTQLVVLDSNYATLGTVTMGTTGDALSTGDTAFVDAKPMMNVPGGVVIG